ncbi:MAG: prepilin-type N-terminal cleavage/methylation domain-containing protein [Acidobacteria bacterium]|nr:prepilin-type N-terminal cleavage/methylation domain-containing protein [Acidobacteriota bacterium]
MKRAKKNESGFSLIELLIVILIIGILAAVLLPRVGQFRKAGNETAAMQMLKKYMEAQLTFFGSRHAYGSPADLVQASLISEGLARQLGATGAPTPVNGYVGSASHSADTPDGLGTQFAMELHPATPGTDGDRYFATDSSGTLYEARSPIAQANGELSLPGDARSIQ